MFICEAASGLSFTPLRDSQAQAVLDHNKHNCLEGCFSPDGQWLVCVNDLTSPEMAGGLASCCKGRSMQVAVLSISEGRMLASCTSVALQGCWSTDGRWLEPAGILWHPCSSGIVMPTCRWPAFDFSPLQSIGLAAGCCPLPVHTTSAAGPQWA